MAYAVEILGVSGYRGRRGAHLLKGGLLGDLGDRLRVQHGELGEGGGAHEVEDVLAAALDAGLAVAAHDALARERPHGDAQIALRVVAELALPCTAPGGCGGGTREHRSAGGALRCLECQVGVAARWPAASVRSWPSGAAACGASAARGARGVLVHETTRG